MSQTQCETFIVPNQENCANILVGSAFLLFPLQPINHLDRNKAIIME